MKIRKPIQIFLLLLFIVLNIGYMQYANYRRDEIMVERVVWMRQWTDWVFSSSGERWRSGDARQAWTEFLTANPNLVVPENFLPLHHMPTPVVLPEVPR